MTFSCPAFVSFYTTNANTLSLNIYKTTYMTICLNICIFQTGYVGYTKAFLFLETIPQVSTKHYTQNAWQIVLDTIRHQGICTARLIRELFFLP